VSVPRPSKRILIVEDAEDIGALMKDLLTEEGYEVTFATSGRLALEYLKDTPHLPQLILLDLMMPDMDGAAFRAEQKKDPRLAGIPVVLMTAAGDSSTAVSDLGANGLLKKPFKDIDSILQSIGRFW
jgi:CheY-like chemotaxis protein